MKIEWLKKDEYSNCTVWSYVTWNFIVRFKQNTIRFRTKYELIWLNWLKTVNTIWLFDQLLWRLKQNWIDFKNFSIELQVDKKGF